MDYGKLLQRAWNIVVQNPYLLLLGILIALTSTSSGSGTRYNVSEEEMGRVIGGGPLLDQMEAWMGVAIAAMIGLMCLAFVIFMLIWIAQQVARGGLIAGVDDIEDDKSTSLGDAWRAGWARKWTLLGIGLVVLIPILVLDLARNSGLLRLLWRRARAAATSCLPKYSLAARCLAFWAFSASSCPSHCSSVCGASLPIAPACSKAKA